MANKQNSKNNKSKSSYKNPINSVWSKVLIFILAFAMCFSGLATLIYLIIQSI